MPRDFASMIRFSIWSHIPSPCRPPISLTALTSRTGPSTPSYVVPLTATGRPRWKRIVTSSGSTFTAGSQKRTPISGSTVSSETSRCSSVFASWVAPQMFASVE
jgi:hypothetical protein